VPNFRATATAKIGDASRIIARIAPRVIAAVDAASDHVLEVSKQLCPVDTGELVSSGGRMTVWQGNKVTGTISYTADHAAYVEFGTGQRGAASTGAGPYPYNTNWKGMVAQPYLRPALDESRAAIVDAFRAQGFNV
jgi:hypothetical protein